MESSATTSTRKTKLSVFLACAMVFAMLMGPGPGLRLVNPDISSPDAVFTIGNVPVIYLWGLFWFAVQLVIVFVAYTRLWSDDLDEEEKGA